MRLPNIPDTAAAVDFFRLTYEEDMKKQQQRFDASLSPPRRRFATWPSARNVRVWVGFTDGRPDVTREQHTGQSLVAVYPSAKIARSLYEDVREARLIFS